MISVSIKGLNDTYANVHTQILLMDPLPSIINEAFSLVSQQERSLNDLFVDSTLCCQLLL